MAFLNVRTPAVQAERRVARRYVVDCPVRFTMAGGDREGQLIDLSEHGACMDTLAPPALGTNGFLGWKAYEHYCKVIWTFDNRCGLQFERPISIGLVEATCSHVELSFKPVATVGRIPLGQRRGSRVAAGRED